METLFDMRHRFHNYLHKVIVGMRGKGDTLHPF